MKNLWKGAVALVFLGASLGIMAQGCVADESSFFIKDALQPSCDVVTTDSPIIGVATLDIRYSCEYNVILVLGNQLVHRGDDNKLQTETSRIEVQRFDVVVTGKKGATIGKFSVPATGFIDPAVNTVPGLGLSAAKLVDGKTGQYLAQNGYAGEVITAKVIARGRTLGGQDVATAEWDYPIDVCDGCLCQVPSNDTCINAQSAPAAQCLITQDVNFDCRLINHNCTDPAVCGVFK